MKKFTIIEAKWARGGKNGTSMLENEEGNRCCLGFLVEACGADPKNHYMPHEIPTLSELTPELVRDKREGEWGHCRGKAGTDLAYKIAELNDTRLIDDETRKKDLAPLFASFGWEPVYE